MHRRIEHRYAFVHGEYSCSHQLSPSLHRSEESEDSVLYKLYSHERGTLNEKLSTTVLLIVLHVGCSHHQSIMYCRCSIVIYFTVW